MGMGAQNLVLRKRSGDVTLSSLMLQTNPAGTMKGLQAVVEVE